MNINSVTSPSAASGVQATDAAQPVKRNSSLPPPPAGGAAATAKISTRGELMAKLSDLAQKDPAKLKEVLSSIASGLKAAASDDQGNAGLSKLADRFSQAAQSGDLSSLAPPQQQQGNGGAAGAQHHHHHHGHGGGSNEGQHSAVQAVFSSALGTIDQALGSAAAPAPAAAAPAAAAPATSEVGDSEA
jgi:hypothetical protein